jgi:hypothetical protein
MYMIAQHKRILAKHCGFTDKEFDFTLRIIREIINYNIKYCMGRRPKNRYMF